MNTLKRKAKNKKSSLPKPDNTQKSDFDKIWHLMTKEEQEINLCNSLCGMHVRRDGKTTILMGSDDMDRYLNFQKQMIEKYSN